jgi:hypothetical protein
MSPRGLDPRADRRHHGAMTTDGSGRREAESTACRRRGLILATLPSSSSHCRDLAGLTGSRQDMLITVKANAPANRISLHPRSGWLTTFREAATEVREQGRRRRIRRG